MDEIEIPLGAVGNGWVAQTLNEGYTLAKYLTESLDISAGSTVTFLPPEADVETAKTHFDWSVMPIAPREEWIWLEKTPDGKEPVMTPVHKVDSRQLEVVREFLQADPDHVLICDNMTWDPTDPVFSESKETLWTYGKEVYHVIFGVDRTDIEHIRQVIGDASSAWQHFIGVMTSFPCHGQRRTLRKELTGLELRTLAQNTQKLIIGAYDNDGYLIWSKPI